ncbi:MAG: hypothetical protein GY844_32695 [Bradyrhizobium sp.]|nr:hypothetical protein [Bradyrhizobium sp.]
MTFALRKRFSFELRKRFSFEWINIVAASAPILVGGCIYLVFLVLAGGSAQERVDDKKARVLKTEGISETTYDSLSKDFGSYDDYKRAIAKGMNARQYTTYRSQKEACGRNWSSCSDNAQLASEWPGWSRVKADCKVAANGRAKYGDPEWPWLAFSSVLKEPDYAKTGTAIAIEPDAKFKNGSNASVRVRVVCNYDLKAGRVENILIIER